MRQKGWKLSNTDAISKLKHDYIKYYKSKGCNSVQFYYNNTLIRDETKSLRELGVSNGGMIYAMENGKAYTQLWRVAESLDIVDVQRGMYIC